MIQYDSDGTLVPSFGTNGIASGGSGVARSVVIQPEGQLLVAGQDESGSTSNFVVQRFNPNTGTLDATFGTGGKAITSVGSGASAANALALYADGRIVAAGYAGASGSRDFALVQYTSAGTVTMGLDGDGIVTAGILCVLQCGRSRSARPAIAIIRRRLSSICSRKTTRAGEMMLEVSAMR